MRRLLIGLALLGLLHLVPARAHAEPVPPADAAAIVAVIRAQLDAFRADDGDLAFSFASPDIRSIFRTPETFMGMVKGGYQPVYRPRSVEFKDLVTDGGRPAQRVLLIGPDGVPVIARYLMERQPDGSWKIDGCVFEKAPDVGA